MTRNRKQTLPRLTVGPGTLPVPDPSQPATPTMPPIVISTGQEQAEPTRVVVLTNEIDDQVVRYLSFHLAELNSHSDEPIIVKMFSPGGDLGASWALYDLLATSRSPIITVGFGHIGSGATLAFLGGDFRLLAKNATFFIHEVQFDFHGSDSDLSKRHKEMGGKVARVAKLYSDSSGRSVAKVRKWMREDTEFTALQAVRHGFADRTIPNRQTAIVMDGKVYKRDTVRRPRKR